MGLFRRRAKAVAPEDLRHQMRDLGYAPIEPMSDDEIVQRLADASFTTPLEERNAYANGLLAWAEAQSIEEFFKLRHLILAVEIARHTRDWHKRFPDESLDLATAKIEGLLAAMTADTMGRTPEESYELYFGPDIPSTLEQMYDALVNTKTRQLGDA